MKARLDALYKDTIKGALQKELGLSNIMQVPALSKIVVNIGVKEAVGDSRVLNGVQKVIEQITGQKAIKTRAKKSIAGFKLREGMPIGVSVTLRSKAMYEFLDRLISLALPRVRDFQGVTLRFDGCGNYNLGIKDWLIFPEVDYDTVDKSRGLNITMVTSTRNDEHARALLRAFKMPFSRD